MNEDGSPASNTLVSQSRTINCSLDGVTDAADNVSLRCSQQLFVSTKAIESSNDLNNNVKNSNNSNSKDISIDRVPIMTNGRVLCSPILIQQQQQQQQQQSNVTGANVLRQIIANDVHSPNNVKVTNMNSRNMVVKTAPHGAVQITYRKMIHSLPEYKKPIAILPKPPTPVQKCSPKPISVAAASSSSQYLSNSCMAVRSPGKFINGELNGQLAIVNNCNNISNKNNKNVNKINQVNATKNISSNKNNNYDNNIINILMNGGNSIQKSKTASETILSTTNNHSNNTTTNNVNLNSNDDLLSSLLSAKSSSLCVLPLTTTIDGGCNVTETVIGRGQGRGSTTIVPSNQSHIPVLGSSRNLNINFPKMERMNFFSPVRSSTDDEIVMDNYQSYSITSQEDMEQTSDQFDSSFEMDDVSRFISSSTNNSNNVSYNGSSGNDSFIIPSSNGTTDSFHAAATNGTFLATNNTSVSCSGTVTNTHAGDAQDIDMDLLSMDIDSLDSITMNTFLQNGTLFQSDQPPNFSINGTVNNNINSNTNCQVNDKSSNSNASNYCSPSGQQISLSSSVSPMLLVNSSVPNSHINCTSNTINNSNSISVMNNGKDINSNNSSKHCPTITTIDNCHSTSIGSTVNNNIVNDLNCSSTLNDINNNRSNNNININKTNSISNDPTFASQNSHTDFTREGVLSSMRPVLPRTSENAHSHTSSPHTTPSQLNIIADVSPDTSTTLGGSKVILIGSWNAKDSRYSCRFGEDIVEAELIQNGVLRCYSPKTSPGKIKLSVLCDNQSSSNEVEFLIVNPSDTSEEKSIKHSSWLSITQRSLLLLLVERITAIAEIIGIKGITNLKEISTEVNDDSQELKQCQERLVTICKTLMVEKVNFSFDYNVENTMTVLHLAAALGFTKFIQLLLKWVETNPNKLIMAEACPTHYDQFSLLPIMWSSAKGHFNTTCVLHQWVEVTIEKYDACGCTAIDLAKECGHETIAEYLERLRKKVHATSRESSRKATTEETIENPSCESQMVVSTTVPCSSPHSGTGYTSKTLGKTLAQIQSMISDQDDGYLQEELTLDGEESLFETSPFSLRQGSLSSEEKSPSSIHSHRSPSSTSSPAPQSPFDRQAFQTAEFCEFFYKAKKIEKDFAELTLTDEEQEDLLRAANVIQLAYKTYKERRNRREQEFNAAVLIQSYYRRYKQYAAFKKMQKGAVIIQNQYRAHREKAKKKVKAATTIQTYYRRYRERKNSGQEDVQVRNKLQQQEDRRVNRYLKQTSSRFSREFPDNLLLNGNVSASSSSSTSPDLQH